MKPLLALVLVLLVTAGCKRQEWEAFHHPTPDTMRVRLTVHPNAATARNAAMIEATTVRAPHFFRATGQSNGYNWQEAYMVAEYCDYDALDVGELITFRMGKLMVVHPIVWQDGGGFITAGTGNAQADFGRVTRENFISRVVSVHTWPQ